MSLDINPFTKAAHADFLIRANSNTSEVASILGRICRWLVRSAEASALSDLRRLIPQRDRNSEALTSMRQTLVKRNITSQLQLGKQVFEAALKHLLPKDWSFTIYGFHQYGDNREPILVRAHIGNGFTIDQADEYFSNIQKSSSHQLSPDRLQELLAVHNATQHSRASFLLVCAGSIVIRDQLGRAKDELDGAILEMLNDGMVMKLVEAKNYGSRSQNETRALKQLEATRKWLRQASVIGLTTRRKRIAGFGALLTISIPFVEKAKHEEQPTTSTTPTTPSPAQPTTA